MFKNMNSRIISPYPNGANLHISYHLIVDQNNYTWERMLAITLRK